MKKLLWTMIAMGGLACAQQTPSDPSTRAQRLIDVKYADPERLFSLLNGPGMSMRYDRSMHVLEFWGTKQAFDEVEAMVKKLDVPPIDVDLTVYLLSGNSQATADEVPKDLAATAKQLHALFPYKSYQVLQSFVVRSRDGQRASNNGMLAGSNAEYSFGYNSATVSAGTPRVVRIDGLNLRVGIQSGQFSENGPIYRSSAGINSDIDIREGQQVVVGKSSVNKNVDDALILVISAKVIEQ